MLNLPYQKQHMLGPIIVVLISITLALIAPITSELLAYKYDEIASGQWWRLLSGHFLHTNTYHLLLNLLGTILLWALHGHYTKTSEYLGILLLLSLSTSIGLFFFAPQLKWYVGLSGILHGLFILGAYLDIKHHLKTGWVMLGGILIKVLNEQMYGASDEVAQLIDANVAIDAHLFGALSGLLLICGFMLKNKLNQLKDSSPPL
ncbi:rhombosortase [Paraglaciecola sp. 2405UD69-4]|uniref:rhombosortase n=1 Tax=Paraglaciecola sp. 2405UD69-4 TaxID=3391836 RepID=UPI0039C954FA